MAEARVFFALWPGADTRVQLHQQALAGAAAYGGRPSRADTLHLTLAFLGNVPEAVLPDLLAVAAQVQAPAFSFQLDTLGYWSHNRILWAGCRQTPAALGELHRALRRPLTSAGFACQEDGRMDWHPHVTLVRKTAQVPGQPPDLSAIDWPCDAFHLLRSRLSSTGSTYEILGRWPLSPT